MEPGNNFEQWTRDTIGADFRWCVRPMDTAENRDMVASLIFNDIEIDLWYSRVIII